MTTDEIRAIAADCDLGDQGPFHRYTDDARDTIATALRHYADHLDRKDKVERLIELGNEMADSCGGYTEHEWHVALAEYRKAKP